MSGPTLDPAGLSHAVVFPALEEECCVPVPVKRDEEQEVTIHNSRILDGDSEATTCSKIEIRRFPIGECVAAHALDAGRRTTRNVDGEVCVWNSQCMG